MSIRHPFNVMLSTEEAKQLAELAGMSGCSRGQVVRWLIMRGHRMGVQQRPTCANGHHCLCPHLFPEAVRDERPIAAQPLLPGVKGSL